MSNESENRDIALRKWEHFTQWPLIIAAVVFLGVYAWGVITNVSGDTRFIAEIILFIISLMFILDYIIRLILAENKRRWFKDNLFDLLVVAWPMLRPLRLFTLMKLAKVVGYKFAPTFRGRIALYSAVSAFALIFFAALVVLDAEQNHPESLITNFSDAIWWAIVTVTTVGYGDLFPVTTDGRVLGVCLMIGGLALFSVVTATLASYIVSKVGDGEQEDLKEAEQILQLREQVASLERSIKALEDKIDKL